MGQPKTIVEPLRRAAWSEALQVRAVCVYGYRAVCSCGWTGRKRGTVQLARAEAREHVCGQLAGTNGAKTV